MERGVIQIYYGEGRGKSTAALGNALRKADAGKNVIIVQFLKAKKEEPGELLQRLEPEIKFFRFEKSSAEYASLDEAAREEEKMNIRNGLNFAKKVLSTGECDLLILDEVLGLIDVGILSVEELRTLISAKTEETTVIMTGIQLSDEVCMLADEVSKIETVNFKVF